MAPPLSRKDDVEDRFAEKAASDDEEAETMAPAHTTSQQGNNHPSSNEIKVVDDEPYLAMQMKAAPRIDDDEEGADKCSGSMKEGDDDDDNVHETSNNTAVSPLEIIDNENDVPSPTQRSAVAFWEVNVKDELAKKKLSHLIHVDGRAKDDCINLSKLESMEGDEENPPPMPVAQLASSFEVIDKDNEEKTAKSSYSIHCSDQLELLEGDDVNAPPIPIEQLDASMESADNRKKGVATGISEKRISFAPERQNAAFQDQTTPPVPGDQHVESASGTSHVTHPTPIPTLPSSQQDADEFLPPPFTILEATLVDDVIYDAVPFQVEDDHQEQVKSHDTVVWWSRRRIIYALLGLASGAAVAGITYYAIQKGRGSTNPTATNLIWKPRGQPLMGNSADDYFGSFVTLSESGNVLAVGTDGLGDDRAGYAKLFSWVSDQSKWEQIGSDITGEIIEYSSSCSVALSRDGTTLAVGTEENDDLHGHVKLYSINGSRWRPLGNIINGEALGDHFGRSVSLSSDGRTVAIGGYKNNGNGDNSGHVQIYQIDESRSEWMRLGNDIDGEAAFDQSGNSVSISADGRVVVIGSPYHMNYFGQARVYYWNDGGSRWEKRGKDLVGYPSDDNFGKCVAISDDGQIVAVGAPASGNDDRTGYARVYASVGDDWELKGEINGTHPGGIFGEALSLSGDGNTLAVGDRYSPGKKNAIMAGCVRVYKFDDLSFKWIQHSQEICGTITYDYFGTALSLAANGETLAISSPDHGSNMGAVWVFSVEN